ETLLMEKLNFIETQVSKESLLEREHGDISSLMLHLLSSFLDLDAEEFKKIIPEGVPKGEAIKNIISFINSHFSEEEIQAMEGNLNDFFQVNNQVPNGLVGEFSFEKLMNFYLSNDFNQMAMNPWVINGEGSSVQTNQLNLEQIHSQFQNIFVEAERIL